MSMQTINGYGNTGQAPVPQAAPAVAAAAEPRKAPEPPPPVKQPSQQQVAEAVKKVASVIQPKASDLKFSIDDDTGKTIVRITDVKTGEMIRQIPSAELVEIAKSLDRMQGLLVKQKA